MWVVRGALKLAIRPWLWPSVLRFLPRRWPFVPSREYIRFRMQTMCGTGEWRPSSTLLVQYFTWCRRSYNLAQRKPRQASR